MSVDVREQRAALIAALRSALAAAEPPYRLSEWRDRIDAVIVAARALLEHLEPKG